MEKAHREVKQEMREDKARARRGDGPDRRRDNAYGARETRRAIYREGSGRESERSASSVETGRGYVTYERTSERDGSSRSGSRDRRSIRDRDDDEDERHSQTSRRGSRYYPPAPARFAAEPSQPAIVSRRASLEPARHSRYYDDAPQPEPEVIYVPRAAAYQEPRSRRASLDRGQPRSYYEDDPDSRYQRLPAESSRRGRYDDEDYR